MTDSARRDFQKAKAEVKAEVQTAQAALPQGEIRWVGENTRGGTDYLVAGIEGQTDLFREFLKATQPQDRVFTPGKLIGTGSGGLQIVRLMEDKQYKERIFACRSDEEDLAVHALKAMEYLTVYSREKDLAEQYDFLKEIINLVLDMKNDEDKISVAKLILGGRAPDPEHNREDQLLMKHLFALKMHLVDINKGNDWLVNLYFEDLLQGNIVLEELEGVDKLAGQQIKYKECDTAQFRRGLRHLPAIILKHGVNPFAVVNSAMPMNDEELLSRAVSQQSSLSPAQRNYALYLPSAAGSDVIKQLRKANSMPVFIGPASSLAQGLSPVYVETNTVNAYVVPPGKGNILVFNMTTGNVNFFQLLKDKRARETAGPLYTARDQLKSWLQKAWGRGLKLDLSQTDDAGKAVLAEGSALQLPSVAGAKKTKPTPVALPQSVALARLKLRGRQKQGGKRSHSPSRLFQVTRLSHAAASDGKPDKDKKDDSLPPINPGSKAKSTLGGNS